MLTVYNTDALTALKEIESESVQCVVTSPPYWNLRDYGTATWEGGDTVCEHVRSAKPPIIGSSSTLGYPANGGKRRIAGANNYHEAYTAYYHDRCEKCGAIRSDCQIGLERTPEEYITNLVEIFREVKRVLKTNGTLWLNLGDSYAGGGGFCTTAPSTQNSKSGKYGASGALKAGGIRPRNELKPKDLCMIPARVAIALQADGWWIRSEITWCKRAPMPESVTDRPTSATEKIFLLTKSERYLYNQDEVRMSPLDAEDDARRILCRTLDGHKSNPTKSQNGLRPRKSDKQRGHGRRHAGFNDRWDLMTKAEQMANGANLRNYWILGPDPFPEAHFATFPREIPLRCILLGSNAGDTTLDPFAGSFTTCKVAIELGRKAVGIEPNPKYVEMGERRCQTTIGLPLWPSSAHIRRGAKCLIQSAANASNKLGKFADCQRADLQN